MSPPPEKKSPLPSDLIGEILSRLPTKSLSRFKSVCKPWNKALWEDKCFLNKYLAHTQPQFILRTNSKICSVSIINLNDEVDDFSIEVRDITTASEVGCRRHTSLVHCDGFLLSDLRKKKGFAVWNPWLRHKRLVVVEKNQNELFRFCGVGYGNNSSYKIFGYDLKTQKIAIYDCKSHERKFIDAAFCGGEEDWRVPKLDSIVSLSGNLYWIAYDSAKTREHFIRSFDFSKEIFRTFCILPSYGEFFGYTQVLAAFKGDRLSVLRQSYMTNEIEILVTKEKIEAWNGKDVVWMKFMTVSRSNIPRLQPKCLSSQPSYFVDDDKKKKKKKRRLFVCTCDETGHACIYIVNEDVLKKIPIHHVVDDLWPSHLTYIPSLFIPIQRGEEEEEQHQVKTGHTKRRATIPKNREKTNPKYLIHAMIALQNKFSLLDDSE